MNKRLKKLYNSLSGSDICGIIGGIFLLLSYFYENAFFALSSVILIFLSRATS